MTIYYINNEPYTDVIHVSDNILYDFYKLYPLYTTEINKIKNIDDTIEILGDSIKNTFIIAMIDELLKGCNTRNILFEKSLEYIAGTIKNWYHPSSFCALITETKLMYKFEVKGLDINVKLVNYMKVGY